MSAFYHKEQIPSYCEGIRFHAETQRPAENEIVVHDLYPFSKGNAVGFWERLQESRWLKKGISKAGSITVFTEYTKTAVARAHPGAAAKLVVKKPLANEACIPTDEDARDVVRYQFTQGDAFFLYRGPIHPAAELINMLKGFSIFKKKIGSNMKLVLCGPSGIYSIDLLAALELYKYKNDVVVTGVPSPYDLVSITAAAYALVHPCRWERFGLPVLDAMKAGVPVLTTEDSPMSELCGMAGMYFNEKDPEDIGEKMIRIYKDEQMRSDMIGTGFLRV